MGNFLTNWCLIGQKYNGLTVLILLRVSNPLSRFLNIVRFVKIMLYLEKMLTRYITNVSQLKQGQQTLIEIIYLHSKTVGFFS